MGTLQSVSDAIMANTKSNPTWIVVADPCVAEAVLRPLDGLVLEGKLTPEGVQFMLQHSSLEDEQTILDWWEGRVVGPVKLSSRIEVT